jgi:hypothetical protein
MRVVWLAVSCRRRNAANEHTAIFDAHVVGRNAILFVPRFAFSCPAVKLPVVPGAHDVVTVEVTLPERPSNMVADAGYRAELAILPGQRNLDAPQRHFLNRLPGKLLAGTDVYPRIDVHVHSLLDVLPAAQCSPANDRAADACIA